MNLINGNPNGVHMKQLCEQMKKDYLEKYADA